ncbi:MAG: helix-turn-helix domain-containing protein [Myxococcales bacterium]|nr:helix-turn-helix domain-containing protein [Myxococcales bacterium]
MELSLEDAATQLGKSVRQVRYLVKLGRLPSRKVAGRYLVTIPPSGGPPCEEPAPSSAPRARAQQRKHSALRAAVEDALDLPPQQRRYSLRDLKAFQVGLPLYQQALDRLGPEHGACRALRQLLEYLSRGCHRVDSADKAEAYRAARDAASQAVCELLLFPGTGSEALVDGIEQDLMAALAGLLRRLQPRQRGRQA